MNKNNKQPLLWGLLHGLNDFAAGYMLARYTLTHNNEDGFLFIVIYAIIGFGGQLPVGFWVDHKKQLKPFSFAALLLLPLAIAAYFISAEAGIILSGFASAFVHVTGGSICLQVHENKTGPLGLFTAPGVLGLTLGGVLARYGDLQLAIAGALVLPLGYLIMKTPMPSYQGTGDPAVDRPSKGSTLDTHDWIMLSILLIMCFRSFIFDLVNHVSHEFEYGAFIIGISAFAGKIIGGFIADRIGWKKFVYITLPIALLLFQFGKENIYALAFGIACLQGSVPVTLMLMGRSLPLYPATAAAFSLGTSIALAGLPLYLVKDKNEMQNTFFNGWTSAAIFLVIFLAWWVTDKALFRKWFTRPT